MAHKVLNEVQYDDLVNNWQDCVSTPILSRTKLPVRDELLAKSMNFASMVPLKGSNLILSVARKFNEIGAHS